MSTKAQNNPLEEDYIIEDISDEQSAGRKSRAWIWIIIVLIIVLGVLAWRIVPKLMRPKIYEPLVEPFIMPEPKVEITTRLKDAVEISELSTAEFHYQGIAQMRDNKDKKDIYICYDSTVKVGIDVAQISFLENEETKVVTAILPELKTLSVTVDSQPEYLPKDPDINVADALEACKKDAQDAADSSLELKRAAIENLKSTVEALTKPVLDAEGYALAWAE